MTEEKKEVKFINGLIVKLPREGAPDFVKCALSFKVDEVIQSLQENAKNGWVNADMLKSKEGKLYVKINTYEPKKD